VPSLALHLGLSAGESERELVAQRRLISYDDPLDGLRSLPGHLKNLFRASEAQGISKVGGGDQETSETFPLHFSQGKEVPPLSAEINMMFREQSEEMGLSVCL
jgi:hypothetical protein